MKPIETPCKKVCAVDGQTGLCLGCGRSLREIGGWTTFSDEDRSRIMTQLDERMNHLRSLGKLGASA
ncbi:DUF1289 domain-containing protein [Henriciella litoralis]|uniref:DUF1289 domain-containing protein n=1 Tax=Henriciella litoralis TaxID=568102 RepID=UPI001F310434|nr:DUF1289 domain-containing protein [Henriciella litoralis]